MAKPSIRAEVNNFIGGLITEASPLNFPPNASLDEENFELNRDGTRDRRLGMGFEPGYVLKETPLTDVEAATAVFSSFKWQSVNGDSTKEFLVAQTGNTLTFFDVNVSSISGEGLIGELELTSFDPNVRYSFTSTEGILVVVSGAETIALVSYITGTLAVTYERLQVRDVWGVEETTIPQYETDIYYRGAASEQHIYNLQNQSWGLPRRNSANVLIDPVEEYKNTYSFYPSNSEVVWTGLQFQPVTAGVTFERMYVNLYEEILGGNVKAPKGYYTIDLLDRGNSREVEFAKNHSKHSIMFLPSVSLPQDKTPNGPSVATEFAGRVWYAGFSGEVLSGDKRSPNLVNYVMFTQLVRNKADFIKCFQDGDPTSRENADLVDTDGGFVRISGAKKIISLIDLESHLIVIADNGVWTVSGGNDYGFSAVNYKVAKVSSFGGISDSTVVIEGGRAFFWSQDGIYVIAKDQFGSFVVTNITQATIQTLYENIDPASKIAATGDYDPISKKIRWVYKTGDRFSSESETKELVLDMVLNVFYQNRINRTNSNNIEVMSLFVSIPYRRGEVFNPVFVDDEQVVSDTESVGINEEIRTTGLQSVRYLTVQISGGASYFAFSYYNNVDFLDWQEVDGVGVDAAAYLLTGQQTTGDSAIAKQIPYFVMYMKRTESGVTADFVPDRQSGCLMRCQWDFANTIVSNKWSPLVQVYRYRRAQYITGPDDEYDNGFELTISKSKVRGRGKAFSIHLETEPGKDCRIVGWSISLNGNTVT